MKPISNFTIADLATSTEFYELHKILTGLTGISLGLADADGKDLPDALIPSVPFLPHKLNPVCQMIRSTEEGCKRCHATDALHLKMAVSEKKNYHYRCHAGMVDFAVPTRVQGEVVGIISCGQVFSSPPTEEGFAELQERLADLNLDEKALREAYHQTPHMPSEKIDLILRLLTFFSEYFCEMGMRLKEAQKDRKYPEIARAKDFIKAKFRETINLKAVADHVFLSENYFSNLFHRVVGVTFSQYLQAVRIEEAKKLLTQTDWSVSQVAFAVGFSSLSYFNLSFRKLEACTPTQYRAEHAEA